MFTLTLSLRQMGNARWVIAETQQPGLAVGARAEAPFALADDTLASLATLPHDAQGQRDYGRRLGEGLFAREIERLFERQRTAATTAGKPLHVLLSVEDESLRGLHWERLAARDDAGQWRFLRLQQQTPLSMYIPSITERRFPAITRVGLNALVVVVNLGPARPYGLAEFDAAATVARLRSALGQIPCTVLACDGEQLVPGADGSPTLAEICSRISTERYELLHLVCHGVRGPEIASPAGSRRRENYLFLRSPQPVDPTDPTSLVERVSAETLLDRLGQLTGAQTLPHLTFLCSCQTATQEGGVALEGLAQRLVRDLGMPAVVAMTRPVSMQLAGALSQSFYQSLRTQGAPDVALVEACAGLAGHGDVLVPNLYSRLGGRALFSDEADLTTDEWELGLGELERQLPDRAPVLVPEVAEWITQARGAVTLLRGLEQSGRNVPEQATARHTLGELQASLNGVAQEALEVSFPTLARGDLPAPAAETPQAAGPMICPFPGLGVFDNDGKTDYRRYFFGRATETHELLAQIERQSPVIVLGNSGSGKSSVVRAGVLPELQRRDPNLKSLIMKPGPTPMAELDRLWTATPNPEILVVDQFEEVFTQCRDPNERRAFIDRLLALRERTRLIFTLRADFLGDCAEHDGLHQLLDADDARHWKLLQPLTGDRLRIAVEGQARAAELKFEPGLLAEVFNDLGDEPGAMALLQHCLRQLWEYRHGAWLKRLRYNVGEAEAKLQPGFRHVGGVKGAIARTAEEVFGGLSPAEQRQCEFLFDRLVLSDLEEGDLQQRRLTRRRVDLEELTPSGGDKEFTRQLVDRLATARLLSVTQETEETDTHTPPPLPPRANPEATSTVPTLDSGGTQPVPAKRDTKTLVEVTHEALIRSWKQLHLWLAAAESTRKLVERVRTDWQRYQADSKPENLTLRGTVLEEAERLATQTPPRLTQLEAGFVRTCRQAETARQDERLQEAREKQRTAEKNRRIFQWLAVAMSLVAGLAGLFYWRAKTAEDEAVEAKQLAEKNERTASDEREKAVTEKNRAEEQKHRAELLVYANTLSNAQRAWEDGNVRLARKYVDSAQWNLRGWEHNYLYNLIYQPKTTWRGHSKPVTSVAFSPDGTRIVSGSHDNTLKVWDAQTGQETLTLTGLHDPDSSVAFSPTGTRIVSGSHSNTLKVWDAQTGQEALTLTGHEESVHSVAFSPDGTRIVSGSYDDTLKVWDAQTGQETLTLTGHKTTVCGVAFSPDGTRIASSSVDGTIKVWDGSVKQEEPSGKHE